MYQDKDIDRLFQEKFKDFEKQPNTSVWESIENNLPSIESKKKRTFIWYRLASIAAVLLLLFVVGNQFLNNENKIEQNIQKSEPTVVKNTKTNEKVDLQISNISTNELTTTKDNSNSTTNKFSTKTKAKTIVQNKTVIKPQNHTKNVVVVSTKNVSKSSENKNTTKYLPKKGNNSLAINNHKTEKTNTQLLNHNKAKQNFIGIEKKKNKDTSISLGNDKKTEIVEEKETAILNKNQDKIDIRNAFIQKTDSDKNRKDKSKRWTVGPSFTPVFYGSLSNGSPVDESIANNDKSSNTSYSYGANVSYKINNKWSVRTGAYNIDLSYTTNNVFYGEQSVTDNEQVFGTNVRSSNNKINVVIVSSNSRGLPNETEFQRSAVGDLEQNSSYIEIPLELKYNVLDKKFGVQLIGGISTLLLNKNEIHINEDNRTFVVGEATNLNKVNYSSNLGIDLSYHISNKWLVNLSPTFKYQFNTFSDNDGGFNPYVLGVYTGLNFKF